MEKKSIETALDFSLEALNEENDDVQAEYDLLKVHLDNTGRLKHLLIEESEALSHAMESNKILLDELELDILKSDDAYKEILKVIYRQKLVKNDWLYLLSSKSMNDAILKYRYIRQYQNFIKKEREQLVELKMEKEKTNQIIQQQLVELNHIKNKQERIILDLQEEQTRMENVISKIKKDKNKISRRHKNKQQSKSKSAQLITEKKPDQFSLNSSNDRPVINMDSNKNKSFAASKRSMPWPVDQGVIVEKFGRRPHDIVENIWIENNGVGIHTTTGMHIKAVHKGVIKQILKIDEDGYMVIIEHGDYLTSYFSIASIFVKQGDIVNEGQIIGQLSNSATSVPILHFEIWRGYDKLNPEHWLIKR